MTFTLPGILQAGPPMLPRDLAAIARLAKDVAGLHIGEMSEALVFSRLARRLRLTGCADFTAYLALVTSPAGAAERDQMIEALTTNITRFYREPAHFRILAERLLPALKDRALRGGRVRLWSAGCSTGEEAYSIAATLLRAFPQAANHDVRILATDINRQVLAEAERGIYSPDRLEGLPDDLRHLLFAPGSAGQSGVTVRDGVRALVTFRHLNLMSDWPMRGPFDAIFCRNVAIYMDQQTQWRLWSRLEGVLDRDGLLLIGHSERLGPDMAGRLRSCGPTSYCRPGAGHTTQESEPWH